VDNKCVSETEASVNNYVVQVVVPESIDLSSFDQEQFLQTVAAAAKRPYTSWSVGLTFSDGNITVVDVFIDDEETAQAVADAITEVANSTSCDLYIICSASVDVKPPPVVVNVAPTMHKASITAFILMALFAFILAFP